MISGFELSAGLQVPGDKDIRRKDDHILFAAAERHLDERFQSVHGLGQEAGSHGQINPAGISNGRRRESR